MTTTQLASWTDSSTRATILSFVERVSDPSSASFVPQPERVAVFDNDGTLWCERPLPIQADFLLERLRRIAEKDPSLRHREPFRAAVERDYAWLGEAITKHYRGDDSDLKQLLPSLLSAYAGTTIEQFEQAASDFLHRAQHPALKRAYLRCTYQPMRELLSLLEQHGFTTYIATGGGRDFVRTVSEELYGVPRERVIGSSVALSFRAHDGFTSVVRESQPGIFDDGPMKPVQIWSTVGRRPIFGFGNANGDVSMLSFCTHASRPSLCALVHHDDDVREYAYEGGSEAALRCAEAHGWLSVSVKNDWSTVFPEP